MSRTKKKGRPPVDESQLRCRRLVLKLTEEERDMLFQIFDQPSVRARQLILRDAKRKK